MEYTMIDLNGMKHESIPEMMKDRLIKKGWQLVSENGKKLEPTLVKDVAEFISQATNFEKKSDVQTVEEDTIGIIEPEIIEVEPADVFEQETIHKPKTLKPTKVRRGKK